VLPCSISKALITFDAEYLVQSVLCTWCCVCGAVYLVQSVCGALYVVQCMWCCVCGAFGAVQGCSIRFFGIKGLIKFVKVLKPMNCSSNLMCNFENGGFCLFSWSYSSKTCLHCLTCIYFIMINEYRKIRTFDGHLKLFPAF
jgi:hypothetical protein